MYKGTLSRIQALTLISIFLLCNSSKAIDLCSKDNQIEIDKTLLEMSLAKAAFFADKTYGKNCSVCAAILEVDKDRIEFHITSQTPEGVMLNTSATIYIAFPSGKILDSKLYHSCKLHTVKSGI